MNEELGLDDYESEEKQDWRRWLWREVAYLCSLDDRGFEPRTRGESKRICSTKTVLYLVGPEDRDRNLAMMHGFSNENLIAVDVNAGNVLKARKSGSLAIQESMESLVLNWKGDPIGAVIMDYCGGVSEDCLLLLTAICSCRAIDSKSVIAMNLLRGRDPWCRKATEYVGGSFSTKHRGEAVWGYFFKIVSRYYEILGNHFSYELFQELVLSQHDRSKPSFFSYRREYGKAVHVFDSVAFRCGWTNDGTLWGLEEISKLEKDVVFNEDFGQFELSQMSRRDVAAEELAQGLPPSKPFEPCG